MPVPLRRRPDVRDWDCPEGERRMWTVVYIARNRTVGQRVREALEREGLLVKLRPVRDGSEDGAVELLVPEAEAEEAHELLTTALGR